MISPKPGSITPLCRADSLLPRTARHSPISPPEAMQLVDLFSALCTLFFTPGIKTASTSHEALSQNKIRKLCWPQPVLVPSLHATLTDALVELGMSYLLPSRMRYLKTPGRQLLSSLEDLSPPLHQMCQSSISFTFSSDFYLSGY